MESNKSTNNTRDWYNKYSEQQLNIGVNLRHYTIIDNLISSGLQKHHKVLEVGCGVGTLTMLIHKYLKKGKLVATDISDESVEKAKQWIPNSDKIDFFVSDMSDFSYSGKFDFIVLPDVMEHIPVEEHSNLFNRLGKLMHDKSILVIHIPHPKALDYIRVNSPEKLQVIDQSLNAAKMMEDAYANDLLLISYNSYCLFATVPDYVFIKMRLDRPVVISDISKLQIIKKKLVRRIRYNLSRV